MAVSPVLLAARAYRDQLAMLEDSAMARLVNDYLRSWAKLESMLNALILKIGDTSPTLGQLTSMDRYQQLQSQIVTELSRLQSTTEDEILSSGQLISLGELHARQLIGLVSVGRGDIATMFHQLPVNAIETMLGFLDPDGPLFGRLRQLTGVNAQLVYNAITEGITLGYNPIKIAGMVRDAFGRGLTDAMRFVRTAQLWAYREANRASFAANSDVVTGWVWYTHFDDRTCMSCVVMHGTVHPVDEPLNDHHNGRCTPIPLVPDFPNPVEGNGIDWFNKQSEETQRHMMGREFYDAWKGGGFDLSEMSTTYHNDVYGEMRGEARLWQLLGAEPPLRTIQ